MTPLDLRLAIVELHNAGKIPVEATADDHVPHIPGANPRSIGIALRALDFEVAVAPRAKRCKCRGKRCAYMPALMAGERCRGTYRRRSKFVMTLRVWRRPSAWSPIISAQLRLKRTHGLATRHIARTSDAAFRNGELLNAAVDRILGTRDVQLGDRGALRSAIREVVDDVWSDAIPRRELAEWLGEDPSVLNRRGLESRVKGLVRFTRQQQDKL